MAQDGMTLSVASFPKRRAITSERAFEARIASELKARGVYSRHMADRFSGLPDRYIAGGRWVEFKSLKSPKAFAFQGLSDAQKAEMTRLAEAGDLVWYVALFQKDDGTKYMVIEQCGDGLHGPPHEFKYPEKIPLLIDCMAR